MKLDVWLKKRRSCIVLKDAIAKKLCRERTVLCLHSVPSSSYRPTASFKSFLFPAETEVFRSSAFPVNRRRRRELRRGS